MAEKNNPILSLVQTLSEAIVYTESSNFDTNRKLWDSYAADWKPEADFVEKMNNNLPNGKRELQHVGDEWSDLKSLEEVLDTFLFEYITPESVVAEIGSGGGRVASRTVKKVSKLHCFDISPGMLKKAKEALKENENAEFHLLKSSSLPDSMSNSLDFIYSFDVLPHVDLHTIWKYVQEIKRVLKPGCKAFIHTANLTAPQGWARFEKQSKYTVGGFYFVSPDIVRTLISRAGLKIVKESKVGGQNIYYNRDFCVVVEKPQE